jgi:hypothetical protein
MLNHPQSGVTVKSILLCFAIFFSGKTTPCPLHSESDIPENSELETLAFGDFHPINYSNIYASTPKKNRCSWPGNQFVFTQIES